jgi:hypothetical protein
LGRPCADLRTWLTLLNSVIVHASFAVVEPGSVLPSDAHLRINVVACLAAASLFVLPDPDDIVFNLHRADSRRDFRTL